MDLFPTALDLAGLEHPRDRIIDGRSLLPMLRGESAEEIHESFFYYRGATLYAVRKGPWKAHFITQWAYAGANNNMMEHDSPLLFHLENDPSEQYNVAEEHPEIVADIQKLYAQHIAETEIRPTQLDARTAQ